MQEGYEGEEEEDMEEDEVVEPPCAKESRAEKPPSEPVQSLAEKPASKPMQSREKPGFVHTDSSRSIGSLASSASLAATVLETPDPKQKCFAEGSGQITPSPPSMPVIVKEVLLVVDSPKKVIKQEPVDKNLADVVAQANPFDREAALQELAKLEAELFLSSYYVMFDDS